jgi:hypothetical protein
MKKLSNSFGLLVIATSMACQPAMAATPDIWLQSAGIGGAGDTITVTRVPVRDASGDIKYKIITIRFRVDANGNPTLAPGFPKVKAAPALIPYTFIAGTYKDSDGCKFIVSGPGASSGGRTSWAIRKTTDFCLNGFKLNAAWVTGPIKGHPNQASLQTAKIIYPGYSYGTVGEPYSNGWSSGDIIGADQSGNQLTLHLFRPNNNVEDSNAVFTLCPGNPASC